LWSLGIKPGDEVIIPANTFIATAWGVTLCGATPVMVDCHPASYNLDPEKVEAAITSKTKAIVAVHLYGQPAEMDRLQEVANQNNLFLVEDAAQAHLAEYNGKKVGGLSIASSFSFYPGKNLGAYGEAGAVLTNDERLAGNLKMLREHGQSEKYCHQSFGHNYRMEGIQGAVLGVKLKYLDKWTEGRRRAAAKYRELLSDLDEIKLPMEMPNAKHVYHLYVIQVNSSNGKEMRDKLQKFLGQNGVASGLHYPIPLHQQNCFNYLVPELSDDKIQYVSERIIQFFVN
jgi:dTDP-4-amino-4,6-dideoxygalactose transaminase